MPQITIYLPKDVAEDLAKWRPRLGKGVSQICQEALEQKIAELDKMPAVEKVHCGHAPNRKDTPDVRSW